MKKNNAIVNYFICLFIAFFILFPMPAVSAQQSTPTPIIYDNSLNTFIDLMNIFLSPGTGNQPQPSLNIATPSPSLSQQYNNTAIQQSSTYVYFPQCDGNFDNIKLPNGCNLCQSGCGPTTVAMILSSYVDKKFAPDTVVNLYKQNGFYAGCNGTKINEAMDLLLQNGLKTTDLMVYDNSAPDNDAIGDFKVYIKSGWTIFALARFCPSGCRHYFWITDVDDKNNVWAYDSFYGRKKLPPPYNENSRYPFPQYRLAFGVRK